MSKKVLLTGATGLIGKETLPFLLEKGFDIYAVHRRNSKISTLSKNVNFIEVDLFDKEAIDEILTKIKVQYLLHFAWSSTGYFNDNLNYDFLIASLELLKSFAKNGGKRAVMAGTYAEYGHKNGILKENMNTEPINIYSECKDFLRQVATSYAKNNNISFAWGRIFSAFGLERDNRRLTAYVINNLKANKEIVIKSGSLIRDYIYSKDTARAFACLLDTNVEGIINICSAEGTSIKDYVIKIATIMNKVNLVRFDEQTSDQQKIVIGDNSKLKNELNFNLRYGLKDALGEVIKMSGGGGGNNLTK